MTYLDANLHHDQGTWRTVSACLHLVNATLIHWHTKGQATGETTTFASEFVAPRITADQIIDLRYTPVYLGVPIRAKCNNKSESMPTSTLCKKSTMSFYHRVREAIAAGYLQLTGRMESLTLQTSSANTGNCEYLATLETSTLLERRYK